MEIFNNIWNQFAPDLQTYWGSVALWRAVGLFFFSFFIVCSLFRRPLGRWLSDERSVEHDAALFNKSEEYISYGFLESFLDQYLAQRMCPSKDAAQIPRLYEEFNRQGNQFFENEVEPAFDRLLRTLVKLNTFLSQHFFLNTDEDSLALHSKRIDKKRYEAYVMELNGLVQITGGGYRSYRAAVKQQLKI